MTVAEYYQQEVDRLGVPKGYELIDGILVSKDAPGPIDPLDVPKGYELIDGVLFERPEMGYRSSYVLSLLHLELGFFLRDNPVGVSVTGEAGYACFPDRPTLVRKPDISVVLCDPRTFAPPEVNYPAAPELVVEVLSPNDKATAIESKIALFLAAGTQLFWVVDPDVRSVMVHRRDGTITRLREPADLSGENLLPGFRVPLAAFLPPLPAATPLTT
jgi:Uma2 family endonuclease